MRITTNMMRQTYQTSLNNTMNSLDLARRQSETGRAFSQSYMDPSAASKAVTLENRYARNNDYIEAVEDTMKWQDVQENVLMQINDMAKEVDKNYSMEALNDTNGEGRSTYANIFRELQQSMIQSLNTKYGNAYVMAGADAESAPFELLADGTVTYRDIDVSSADAGDMATLTGMEAETAYVDFGFGLEFDATGAIVPSSAFDSALPGISVIGHGVDADGDPQNMIALLGEMANVLDQEPFDSEGYERLWTKFGDGADKIVTELAKIGTKSTLMDSTLSRLETENDNIIEQFDGAVNIEQSEAILNFTYQNYVYNMSLRIGTQILTPSLLDFLQ